MTSQVTAVDPVGISKHHLILGPYSEVKVSWNCPRVKVLPIGSIRKPGQCGHGSVWYPNGVNVGSFLRNAAKKYWLLVLLRLAVTSSCWDSVHVAANPSPRRVEISTRRHLTPHLRDFACPKVTHRMLPIWLSNSPDLLLPLMEYAECDSNTMG